MCEPEEMNLSISTHWNAGRHDCGEAMVDEILALGFNQIELGYNLHDYHLPGLRRALNEHKVTVSSVHNYCPVPPGISNGHPEIYTLGDHRKSVRQKAISQTAETIRFAAECGAGIVVMHLGNVRMRNYSRKLSSFIKAGKRYTDRYDRIKMKAVLKREKKVTPQIPWVIEGLQELAGIAQMHGVVLGFEILPTWEAIPNDQEITQLIRTLNHPHIQYWHDTGHGQIREELGFANHLARLREHLPHLAGMHIHDVKGQLADHHMPPGGKIHFKELIKSMPKDCLFVLEPSSSLPSEKVVRGRTVFSEIWHQIWHHSESDVER